MSNMSYMSNIELTEKATIGKITTSIGLKLATKHRLSDLARKGESYDDVIVRLIGKVERLEGENETLRKRLESMGAEETNLIEISQMERGLDNINLSDGTMISFGYNKPLAAFPNNTYIMDIEIDRIVRYGKNLLSEDVFITPSDEAMARFWMITRVINLHMDPAFRIPAKTMVIDPVYWKRVWERVGLPWSSFNHDILSIISDYEGGSA